MRTRHATVLYGDQQTWRDYTWWHLLLVRFADVTAMSPTAGSVQSGFFFGAITSKRQRIEQSRYLRGGDGVTRFCRFDRRLHHHVRFFSYRRMSSLELFFVV